MKKINKVLLSICMLFIISFSLVSCSLPFGNNNNGGNNPPQSYTPPTGVDMTSATAYATWLKENLDITLDYEAEVIVSNNLNIIASGVFKHQYKNKINCLAIYDDKGTLGSYFELSTIIDKIKYKIYDLENLTYSEYLYEGSDLSLLTPYGHICFFLEYPENQFKTEIPETTIITRSIEKKSTGKYVLTNKITYETKSIHNEVTTTGTGSIILKLVVENNKIMSFEYSESNTLPNSDNVSRIYSYSYKDVTIDFDTSKYVLDDYNEPSGVNMSSVDEYANYLKEDDSDETLSYKVTLTAVGDDLPATQTAIHTYKNNVSCLAIYDENNQIIQYYEYDYTNNDSIIMRIFDLSNSTYREITQENNYNFYVSRSNMIFFADTQIFIFLNYPEINFSPNAPGITVTKNIEKTAYATYLLTKNTLIDNEDGKASYTLKQTYHKDLIVKFEMIVSIENNTKESGTATFIYEYGNYEINLNKSNFTKVQ